MLKITRKPKEIKVEETKEETKMNVFKTVKGWSLKKKILVGAGAVGTTLLGVFAYGKLNESESENEDKFDDENEDGCADDDYDDEESKELVEMEKQENQE